VYYDGKGGHYDENGWYHDERGRVFDDKGNLYLDIDSSKNVNIMQGNLEDTIDHQDLEDEIDYVPYEIDEDGGHYDEYGVYFDADGGYYDENGWYYDAEGGIYDEDGNSIGKTSDNKILGEKVQQKKENQQSDESLPPYEIDKDGGYYDENGVYFDADGGYYDENGWYYDANGGVYDENGNYLEEDLGISVSDDENSLDIGTDQIYLEGQEKDQTKRDTSTIQKKHMGTNEIHLKDQERQKTKQEQHFFSFSNPLKTKKPPSDATHDAQSFQIVKENEKDFIKRKSYLDTLTLERLSFQQKAKPLQSNKKKRHSSIKKKQSKGSYRRRNR